MAASETTGGEDTQGRAHVMQLTIEQRRALYSAAMRYCGYDHAVADDLVQDTCVRGWQSVHSLGDSSRLLPWLLSILHNGWIDLSRKRITMLPVADVPERPAEAEGPSFWQRLTTDDLHGAIEQLEEPYRSAARLQYLGHLSNTEIATQLGVPYATAATRLHRVRKQLRDLLSTKLELR
jgi:RNA polymerase sigma-70 factor, ECF subfamily